MNKMENTHAINFFLPVNTQVRDRRRPEQGSITRTDFFVQQRPTLRGDLLFRQVSESRHYLDDSTYKHNIYRSLRIYPTRTIVSSMVGHKDICDEWP